MSRPYQDADVLRACLEGALAERPNPPAETCFRTGTYGLLDAGTHDNDCCDGIGWVRIVSIDSANDALGGDANPCGGGFIVTYEMGVARCQPFGTKERGITCEQWSALALQIDDDAEAMRAAVCCLASAIDAETFDQLVLPGSWAPMEAEGGCAGGTMQVSVTYNNLRAS